MNQYSIKLKTETNDLANIDKDFRKIKLYSGFSLPDFPSLKPIFIFLISLFCISTFSWGQRTIAHFDRNYYFPGQVLHYQLYTQFVKQDSALLQIYFYSENYSLPSYFLMLRNGMANGYFSLPFDMPHGDYAMVATLLNPTAGNFHLFEGFISILNPNSIQEESSVYCGNVLTSLDSLIEVKWSSPPARRSQTSFDLSVKNGRAGDRISVSIHDSNYFSGSGSVRIYDVEEDKAGLFMDQIPIKGTRNFINTEPNDKAFLFAAEPESMLYSFNRVEKGDFLIRMLPFYGSKNFYFLDNGRNEISVSLSTYKPPFQKNSHYCLEKNLKISAEHFKQRRTIYDIFSTLEESVSYRADIASPIPLDPDYDIDVSDYSVRGQLVDLLKELITPLKFRRNKDETYSVKVLYEVLGLKYFYDSDPVFFINGTATRDFTWVATLPLQEIKRLKMYTQLETIRKLKLVDIGGIFLLETVDPSFSLKDDQKLPSHQIQGLQLPFLYPVQADSKSFHPQLKSLLYWNPDLLLDDSGSCSLSFPVSDDLTDFQIIAVHYSTMSAGRKVFQVRDVH